MTRWRALEAVPERLWITWDPERWWLPVPLMGVALLPLAAALGLTGGRRSGGLVMALGFLWAALCAWAVRAWRLRLRRRLAAQASPDDWVCPACLHRAAP
ncbi:hypothetical protein [uncultured Deinococcus sp.]|uniref:hypothetical protein n=1 Tax=uncultured Deinococcus sp. TaxID=158789 RepID=UPI0025F7E812|nr:hypothetical protein [uncultured Deinococcus sp.]